MASDVRVADRLRHLPPLAVDALLALAVGVVTAVYRTTGCTGVDASALTSWQSRFGPRRLNRR